MTEERLRQIMAMSEEELVQVSDEELDEAGRLIEEQTREAEQEFRASRARIAATLADLQKFMQQPNLPAKMLEEGRRYINLLRSRLRKT